MAARPATLANVVLTQLAVTPVTTQVRLNVLTGAVEVKNQAAVGAYQLVYRICEVGTPANCSQATATVILTAGTGVGGGGGGGSTTFKISVGKNGIGTVTANPIGPNYATGTVVTLTATPGAGQPWVGWGGACSGTATACTLTITSDQSVTANFRLGRLRNGEPRLSRPGFSKLFAPVIPTRPTVNKSSRV